MKFDDYVQFDGLGLAELVRRGEVSPEELLSAATQRADQVNGTLNAITRRYDDRARQRVKQGFRPEQPFGGVPFLLKDLFQEWQGVPCSWGNAAHARRPAPVTSDVVRRWEEAGVVIFGATNTPEFGAKNMTEPRDFGPARNPWNPAHTPGGSSGGSGSAVAAGIVPVAGASDGGGSIRIPAACNGLFGLKVGRGRVSIGPMAAEGLFGAAVQGVLSRSVRDTAAMLDVLQGPEPHAPYWMPPPDVPYLQAIAQPPRRLRIGFSTESPTGTPVDPQAIEATQDAARLLDSLGHHVEPVKLPFDGKQLSADFLLVWFCAQAMLIDELCRQEGLKLSDFEPDTQVMAAMGRTVSAPELCICLERWHQHTLDLARFHSQYDLWLSPTLAGPPLPVGALTTPPALHMVNKVLSGLGLFGLIRKTDFFQEIVLKNLGWTPYTQLANLTGRPAISVPLYWTPSGLPLGVQLVGGVNSEALLLQLGAQLEQARPWFHKRPKL
jgi:amidase